MSSAPSRELLESYSSSVYRTRLPSEAVADLLVGLPCPREIESAFDTYQASECIWITAYNPRSRQMPQQVNEEANRRLLKAIEKRGLQCLESESFSTDGTCEGEAGYLVFGAGEEVAQELMEEFDQYAVVYCRRGESAKLVMNSKICSGH